MKLSFPLIAAFGLLVLWGGMLYAIPQTVDLFADFKINMPPLALATVWVSRLFGGMALPVLVLATAVLVGLRQFVGWVYALVLCVAWNLAFAGLVLHIITLIEALSGGAALATWFYLLPVMGLSSVPGVLVVAALLLNQVLLVLLITKRRQFGH